MTEMLLSLNFVDTLPSTLLGLEYTLLDYDTLLNFIKMACMTFEGHFNLKYFFL